MSKTNWIFGHKCLDLSSDDWKMVLLRLLLIRFGLSMVFGEKNYHPD